MNGEFALKNNKAEIAGYTFKNLQYDGKGERFDEDCEFPVTADSVSVLCRLRLLGL